MKRTITVARTAPDLEHVNKVRSTTFGIRELRLKLGDKTSRSNLAAHAPPPEQEEKGTNDFHFAPKEEKPKIVFKLDDRSKEIDKVILELFRRDKKEAVWKKELEEKDRTDGEHEIEWDGKIEKNDEFPEAYITAEHSPYKLKLTIEAKGTPDSVVAWTYFHVLIHSFKLELGDKTVLKRDIDKALWDVLKSDGGDEKKAIPEGSNKREVKLVSNLFSTNPAQMTNNTGYTEYKNLWGDGPNIPIFAKLLLKKSDDKEVEVPEAVGKVRLQWDYEDQEEDTSRHHAKAKEYLDASLDRYKAKTKPKGDNCHKDHGGKRGDDAKALFPAQAGYKPADALEAGKFPFKVEAGGKRKWSSWSEAWATGKLKGWSGVLFEPSRMAGDAVKVVVRFPYVRKPDGKDDLDTETEDDKVLKDSISHTTGIFQVWRELHIVKYIKKKSTITDINLGTVADYYEKAWIKMVDKSGGSKAPMADYDTKLRAQVNAETGPLKYALEPGDQGTTTESSAKFRSQSDFEAAVKAGKSWNQTAYDAWAAANIAGWEDFLQSFALKIIPKACDDYLSDKEGVTILQFNLYFVDTDGLESGINGFASTDFPSGGRKKAAFIQARMNYGAGNNNMQQTTTHEIGHTLFLPHTKSVSGDATDEALHDQETHWGLCTMSYNYTAERKFCGLCLLRLRGWDPTNLDKDRTKNTKT